MTIQDLYREVEEKAVGHWDSHEQIQEEGMYVKLEDVLDIIERYEWELE